MGTTVARAQPAAATVTGPAPARKHRRLATFTAVAAALFAALFISRRALFPRYLITFDEINFAFAIREFNLRLHQPQPPGYPLFVGLLKILSPLFSRVEPVFLVAGLLLSAASLIFIWKLGELSAGPGWGWSGVLLLLFNPAFWLSALTNPVRLSLAFGSSLVACCLFKALSEPAAWLPAAAAALGLMAGFQPTLLVLMAPLLLWVAIRTRIRWRLAMLSLLCLAGSVALWLPVLVHATGGWRYFFLVLRTYSDAQFSGTSLVFGARVSAAVEMAWQALVWSCLGALSWLPLLPFAIRKPRHPSDWLLPSFLAIWFLPGFLFYAVIHVADPDHTLSIVPATCVAGAAVMAAIAPRIPRRSTPAVILICVLLNVLLFFKPISQTAKASTYKPVAWVNRYTTRLIEGLHGVQREHPIPAVFHASSGIWRVITYYFPQTDLILVDSGQGRTATLSRLRSGKLLARTTVKLDDPVQVCGPLVFFNPTVKPSSPDAVVWESPEPGAFLARPPFSEPLGFYGLRFVSSPGVCSAGPPEGKIFPVLVNPMPHAAHAP